MSNTGSHDRRGQPPASRAQSPLSLSYIGRDEEPLLIPMTPSSSIDEIIRMVRESGAKRVELLVPDGTAALQSIAGNEMLRDAAKDAGIRVTIFTADDMTAQAARLTRLDVVSVGGTVAAPRSDARPRRTTGQRPAQSPRQQAAPSVPQRPAAQPPTSVMPGRSAQPAARPAQPRSESQPQTASAPSAPALDPDAEFLSSLAAIDQSSQAEPPRVHESDEGALLYDVPGDIGVPRPADDDQWPTADRDHPTVNDALTDLPPASPAARRRQQRALMASEPRARPSLIGALLGQLPQRSRRVPETLPEDERLRVARPEGTPEDGVARRRRSRGLTWLPLVLIALIALVGIGLVLWSQRGSLNFIGGPTLTVAPPLNDSTPIEVSGQEIPLVTDPVSDPASINVQGVVLSAPVEVTLPGTTSKSTVAPIGFARGAVTLRNRSSQAVTIPAGTAVQAGGQEFLFDTDVTVPGSVASETGITFGAADGALTARTPGSQGNIPAGTITAIPGYTGNQGPLTVSQNAPFAGGTDQEVQIVTPDDVSALLPEALTRLYGAGVQSLQTQAQQLPGFAIVQSEGTPEITPTVEMLKQVQLGDYTVFPAIGQVTQDGKFTLQMKQEFQALASPTDKPIEQQLRQAVLNVLRSSGRDVSNADVNITGWRRGNQGLIVDAIVTPRTGYQQIPAERQAQLEAEIKQELAGKSRVEAEAYLNQLKSNGTISDYTLPPDLTVVPDNLRIDLREPTAVPAPSSQP